MSRSFSNWLSRAIRLMLLAAAVWVIYVFSSNYLSCRAYGTSELTCFAITLFRSGFEILAFVVTTTVKILRAILP
jgi:hypothetical protein